MDLKQRVREVLEQTHLMSLGVVDEGGVWVSDVIFVFDDDLNVYWMSDPEARRSRAIEKTGRAAGTITATTKSGEPNFGIQFEGAAEKINGPRHDLAVKHYAKRGKAAPLETDDVLDGDAWYKLTPTKLRLIDETNFGFEAQDVI
jgi:uncharacterized protein YhbP (UPF0306 family)